MGRTSQSGIGRAHDRGRDGCARWMRRQAREGGRQPARLRTRPPARPPNSRRRCAKKVTVDAMMGAPDETAGDRRRARRQPRDGHPRLRRQRRLRRRTHCGTRDSTCRRPNSRCACRSPTIRSSRVGGATIEAKPLQFTIGTPPDGVSGPLVAARVEDSPGCTASDYDGLPVQGAVVLVDRGTCQFSSKQSVAADRGARRADRRQQRGRRRDGRHAR